MYNLKKTKIIDIKRQDENTLIVKIVSEDNNERTGYIRARTRNGVRELEIIELNASILRGKSYDELISYEFKG